MPPANYNSDFLTKEEQTTLMTSARKLWTKYLRILTRILNDQMAYGKRKHCTLNCKEVLDGFN